MTAMRTALIIGVAAAAFPALAQDNGRASDRALAPFVACRPIADARARAACYDAALDRLQQSVVARQVVIMDREQVAVDRKAMFGFNGEHAAPKPPRPPKAAKPVAPDELAEIDSTVTSAQPYGYDQWTIRIATGAVWRTTESGLPLAPKAGTKVHIHRALMGSYMLRIAGRAVRAVRVG